MDSTNTTIILFPDFEKLKNEIEKMRTELSMLMLEHDELKFVICRNIETAYMLKLGSIEYKTLETHCAALRLKRKVELIQAKKNRQEKIILSDIEKMLDHEFEEFRRKLDEQIAKMNEAIKRSRLRCLTPEETKEIKKLYRQIVKVLHPDINPDITEAQLMLFENAVKAFDDGDLETMRIISEMVGNEPLPENNKDAMKRLKDEKERLQHSMASIRENIEKIKSQYPYTLKDIAWDDEKTEKRKREYEKIIAEHEKLISIYNAKIEEMLKEQDG